MTRPGVRAGHWSVVTSVTATLLVFRNQYTVSRCRNPNWNIPMAGA
jgi:hypothetical protein